MSIEENRAKQLRNTPLKAGITSGGSFGEGQKLSEATMPDGELSSIEVADAKIAQLSADLAARDNWIKMLKLKFKI